MCLSFCPQGGVSRPIPRGEVEASGWRGLPGPYSRGKVERSGLGGSGPSPGVRLMGLAGGVSRPIPKGGLRVWAGGCIPPCTEADSSPSQQTATAADGKHPTGMHSCLENDLHNIIVVIKSFLQSCAHFPQTLKLLVVSQNLYGIKCPTCSVLSLLLLFLIFKFRKQSQFVVDMVSMVRTNYISLI